MILKDPQNRRALTDILAGYRKHRCWRANEKSLAHAICTEAFHPVVNCHCGASEGCFSTRRISVSELRDMIGEDVSKRAVQRDLHVLCEIETDGVIQRPADGIERPITAHRRRTAERLNEKNWYTFHSLRWQAWNGKPRPKSWHADIPASDPPPPIRVGKVEAARIATGRSPCDPAFAKLARDAARLDKRVPNAYRAAARANAYVARAEAEDKEFEGMLAALQKSQAAGGGAGVVTVSTSGMISASSTTLSLPPPVDLSLPPGADETAPGRSAADRAALDGQILEILREYEPLLPLATERRAHLIGQTARKYKKWIGLVRIALGRLAHNIRQGKASAHIALARAYVKRQWPIAHPPIELPPRPEEPEFTAEELAALTPEELAALGASPEHDPTPEELAALRAHVAGAVAIEEDVGGLDVAAGVQPRREPAGGDVFRVALTMVREQSPLIADMWLRQMQFDGIADAVLSLRARNDFVQQCIPNHVLTSLCAELGRLTGQRITVSWTIDPDLDRPLA